MKLPSPPRAITDRLRAYSPALAGVFCIFISSFYDSLIAARLGRTVDDADAHFLWGIGIALGSGWLLGGIAMHSARKRIRAGGQPFDGPGSAFSIPAIIGLAILAAVVARLQDCRPILYFGLSFTCYSIYAYAAPTIWRNHSRDKKAPADTTPRLPTGS